MSEILGAVFKTLLSLLGIAAVAAAAYQVFGTDKIGGHISNLTQMSLQIQGLYSTVGNFTSLTNSVVVTGKLAPELSSSGSLRNPWNGSMTVAVNGSSASRYDVTDPSVPADACAKIASSLSSLVGLSVNGAAQTLPADPGTLVAACNQTGNTLIYTFGR